MGEGKPPYSNIHPMRAIFMIPSRPPPKFTEPEKWSKELNEFLSKCLTKNPEQRPTADELLKHPFIQKAKSTSVLLPLINEVDEIIAKIGRETALGLGEDSESDEDSSDEDSPSSPAASSSSSNTSKTNSASGTVSMSTMVVNKGKEDNNNYSTMVVNDKSNNNNNTLTSSTSSSSTMRVSSSTMNKRTLRGTKDTYVPQFLQHYMQETSNTNANVSTDPKVAFLNRLFTDIVCSTLI